MYKLYSFFLIFNALILCGQENKGLQLVNGTLRLNTDAIAGDTLLYEGVPYLIVDNTLIREYVSNGKDLSKIITSKVTDMSFLFYKQIRMKGSLSSWDTSNVTTMSKMFCWTENLNPNVTHWDTSNVKDFGDMFRGNKKFNRNINHWDVSQGVSFAGMFHDSNYNQYLNDWDMSNAKNLSGMFDDATYFNQSLDKWDVSTVENMGGMFAEAINFNQDISNWDVSKVTSMRNMFRNANTFRQDLSLWNVISIEERPEDFSLNADFTEPKWNKKSMVLQLSLLLFFSMSLLFFMMRSYRRNLLQSNNSETDLLLKYLKKLNKSSLSRSELDAYLNIQDKSLDSQKRIRATYIKKINTIKRVVITRDRCPVDSRTYIYKVKKR